MPDQNKEDPGKKPMDDWFVGNDDVVQRPDPAPTQKPVAPAPPAPNGKPPGKGPLVAVLVLLALLGGGGYYFYTVRFRPVKVEEVTVEMPKQPEAAPPVAPIPLAPPAPRDHSPSVSAGARPAKRPAAKKAEEEPVQSPRPKEEPAAPKVKVEAPPKPAPPPVAPSGIMLWSGKVEKNGTIVIDGGKSETGTVNGAVLPGVPVNVRVEPKGFTVAEPPSAATGWKRMAIHSQKKAHIVVTVYWDVKPN
jgi:hypothetical protein